jgi:hypothetical protein
VVVAAVLDGGQKDEAALEDHPATPPCKSSAGGQAGSESFSEAWRLLAARNLSFDQRRGAQRELLDRWAEEDPLHLMRFFEGRAAPQGWSFKVATALREHHPDLLVRFARDHGALKALQSLAEGLDPRRAFDLLAKEPGVPPGYFREVAKRGAAADPDFADRVDKLPDEAAKEAFRCGVMEIQLEAEQWEAAAETLGHLQEESGSMAFEFGRSVAGSVPWDRCAGVALALPEELRARAIEGMLHDVTFSGDGVEAEPGSIRAFLEEVAGSGLKASLPHVAGLEPADAEEWGRWALNLPEGGTWETLRRSGLELWLEHDESAASAVLDLPPGVVRDTAMEALVRDRQRNDDEQGAAQALDLMSPEARARLERELAQESGDPFAE